MKENCNSCGLENSEVKELTLLNVPFLLKWFGLNKIKICQTCIHDLFISCDKTKAID